MGENNLRIANPIWPLLTGIHVLVVMDGSPAEPHYATFGPGDPSTDPTYGDRYFGLSEFLRSLTGSRLATFVVTKAHRDTDVDGHADIEHFRFDSPGFELSDFDEILLFGLASSEEAQSPMSDAELAALARFMDGGGGVFATGDHEDLGVSLCGRIPRVRSMRKWYFPDPGPNGEPVAPPPIGAGRVETTQRGVGQTFTTFDDQSDDIPQPIRPLMYSWQAGFLGGDFYPHPLLCSTRGVIRVLPDHMHEGEVIVPWDLSASFTFDGHKVIEYPTDAYGYQERPEIVAWGAVLGETNTSTEPTHVGDPTSVANPRSFGVVGAYDGHRVGVGRVAVDSTWHHFFDINLIGDPVAPFPKTEGFRASADGLAALADIESYFQNIGTWLARPGTHQGLFAAAAWYATRSQPLAMVIRRSYEYNLEETVAIGALGLRRLLDVAPPCTVTSIIWRQIVDGPVEVPHWDPWRSQGALDEGPLVNPDLTAQVALGGAIVSVARASRELARLEPPEAAATLRAAAAVGVAAGLRQFGAEIETYSGRLKRMAAAMAKQPVDH